QVSAAQVAASTALTPHRQKVVSQVGVDGYTSEPLVARVEAEGGVTMSLLGPSLAVVPAGTPVHWHIVEGGGKLFATTTMTDDSAYTLNRWAPGTKAGKFTASAGRLLPDGTIVADAMWELEVLPGPVDRWLIQLPNPLVIVGDTIDLAAWPNSISDAYGNTITAEDLAGAGATIGWAWAHYNASAPATPTDTGWEIVVPAEPLEWPTHYTGADATLYIYVDGRNVGGKTLIVQPNSPPAEG